jgi:hypothetical protein
MTTRREKAKREAEELLKLREKHKQSRRECDNCVNRPLSSRDPLGAVILADPDMGKLCPGCKAILEDADAFYVVAVPPRGLPDDTA